MLIGDKDVKGVFGKERDKGSDKGEEEWGRKGRCGVGRIQRA